MKKTKIPIDWSKLNNITPFDRDVYMAALSIPFGQTRSYKWIANRIGKPNAARAVGQALKKNPFPLIIPCHRVVSSKPGSLGGFSLGLELKKELLDIERKLSKRD
jgi:methylated-DNA-[protein]-cysteine S-methyltransferase